MCSVTYVDRNLSSSLAGYLIVVMGVLASLVFNATVYYKDQPPVIYFLYAPLAFYRAIFIMTVDCTRFKCIELDTVNSEMVEIYLYLMLDTVLYWVMFLYLDKVMPSKWGVPRSPIFCLKPMLRRFLPGIFKADDDRSSKGKGNAESSERETDDSQRERRNLLAGESDACTVRMMGLQHTYDKGLLGKKSGRQALVDLYLAIRKGEALALLGPNGAGKSTLISILTGLFQPSAGTAYIEGRDIATEMDDIHKLIGICPQFSLLWGQLTCREHLLFFARLKGVHADEIEKFVLAALEKVRRCCQRCTHARTAVCMYALHTPLSLTLAQ